MLQIYWVYLKTAIATQLQYRTAMAIWMINRIIEPIMFLVIWVTVAKVHGTVGSYDAGDFAAYFITLMVVNQLTFTWILFEFERRIRGGELSPMLLKPVHPIHSDIADNLGYKILTLIIILPTAVLLTVLFNPSFKVQISSVVLGFLSLVVAYFIRMLIDWSFALTGFWTTRTAALNEIYFLFVFFCSGRLAPLELLPPWLERITWLLPFRWTGWFTVELALNRMSPSEILTGFQMQGLWLLFGLLLVIVVWRLGVRKYSAVGS